MRRMPRRRLDAMAWFVVGFAPFAAVAQISFAPGVHYGLPQANGANWMVTADFNGDGRPDVAVAISIPGSISAVALYLNKGDGTLLPAVIYGTGSGDVSNLGLVTIDLNRDGHPDLVAFSNSGLSVFLNRGDGTFLNPVVYGPTVVYAHSVVAGDFNGDGKKDIAVVYQSRTSPYTLVNVIYLSNGDGTLTTGSTSAALNGETSFADVADVNGDGIDDIMTYNYDTGFSILFGQRSGIMSSPTLYPLSVSYPVYHFADVDGDGKPDVIFNQQYAVFSVMINDGTGRFGPPRAFDVGNYGYGMSLVIADFNRDGSNDIVAGPWGDGRILNLFANDGSGNFGTPTVQSSSTDTCCSNAIASAIADFDGDGLLDIAYAHGDRMPEVVILHNTTVITSPTITLTAILPNQGGNTGSVSSVEIVGTGMPSNSIVKLTGPGPDIVAANVQISSVGNLITCSFNLLGATPGSYSLVLTKPDGTILLSKPAAFTVQQGGSAQISVDIIGRSQIRLGVPQTYYIVARNTGNLDAGYVSAWMAVPTFVATSFPSDSQPTVAQVNGQTLMAFDIPSVAAGGIQIIPITLQASSAFQITVWNALP